jgi:hypothetical protein
MEAIKGIYHNGVIELIEKPESEETAEVLVIFPQKGKKIKKIGGLFKKYKIDYEAIEQELKELSHKSQNHMVSELQD